MTDQLDQIRAWLAGDLYPEHEMFSMGRGFAQAVIDEVERVTKALRDTADLLDERYGHAEAIHEPVVLSIIAEIRAVLP